MGGRILEQMEAARRSPLFAGIADGELEPLLKCLQAQKRAYPRGSLIVSEGETVTQLGIVLSGRVYTVYEDTFGGRSIISTIEPGQNFCDAYACTAGQRTPVSVSAKTDCAVLMIEVSRILRPCGALGEQQRQLLENLVHLLAEKYAAMSRKLIHLSGRTTRRKLLSYLSEQMRLAGRNPFPMPYTQQEIADDLFTDRSGLSTEWNRLKKEGVLSVEGGLLRLNIPPCAGADCGEK